MSTVVIEKISGVRTSGTTITNSDDITEGSVNLFFTEDRGHDSSGWIVHRPVTVDHTGITVFDERRQLHYIQSDGGLVTIDNDPQISAGFQDGDELRLVGMDSVNYPAIDNGRGVNQDGKRFYKQNVVGNYTWDQEKTYWTEASGRDWNGSD